MILKFFHPKIRVSAFTFSPKSEPFRSNISLPRHVVSPPALTSHPTYTTVAMSNQGQFPTIFEFQTEDHLVWPPLGIGSRLKLNK